VRAPLAQCVVKYHRVRKSAVAAVEALVQCVVDHVSGTPSAPGLLSDVFVMLPPVIAMISQYMSFFCVSERDKAESAGVYERVGR